jgi:hypothetical protein
MKRIVDKDGRRDARRRMGWLRPACVRVCALTHLYGCEVAGYSLSGPQHVLERVAHVAEYTVIIALRYVTGVCTVRTNSTVQDTDSQWIEGASSATYGAEERASAP